jgi:hypothetical protein
MTAQSCRCYWDLRHGAIARGQGLSRIYIEKFIPTSVDELFDDLRKNYVRNRFRDLKLTKAGDSAPALPEDATAFPRA